MFPTVVNRIFMHFVTSRMKKAKDNSMPDIKQYFCFNKLILAENVAISQLDKTRPKTRFTTETRFECSIMLTQDQTNGPYVDQSRICISLITMV